MTVNLLNSEKAIETSIYVVRAFVKMRQAVMMNKKVTEKLSELETRVEVHDEAISSLFKALRELLEPVLQEERKKIGLK